MLGLYHISYCPEVDRQNSCARGGVLVSKRKAQLAPGLHNHSSFGVAPLYHGNPAGPFRATSVIRIALLIMPMKL